MQNRKFIRVNTTVASNLSIVFYNKIVNVGRYVPCIFFCNIFFPIFWEKIMYFCLEEQTECHCPSLFMPCLFQCFPAESCWSDGSTNLNMHASSEAVTEVSIQFSHARLCHVAWLTCGLTNIVQHNNTPDSKYCFYWLTMPWNLQNDKCEAPWQ